MKKKRILIILIVVFSVLAVSCVYVSDYYRAEDDALLAVEGGSAGITVTEKKNSMVAFIPESPVAGFIFYPGAKVQYESYAPLMEMLAEHDILCVILHMPFNMAILDINAASGIQSLFPEVSRWFIGGHSLGGAMASSFLKKHSSEYEGLVLLASYSTADLSSASLRVLSIYGSEDKVLNAANYNKNLGNLSSSLVEIVIPGGCHAYFGSYGPQKGDGAPSITRDEQYAVTVGAILDFIGR